MAFLNDLTPQQIVARLLAYLVFAALHGAALAGLARLFGDPGPKHAGRLTLNPFAHATAGGAAMAALFLAGWIRPMAIDPARLRGGRVALAGLALAALAAMLALIPLLDLLRPEVVQTFEQSASYYLLFQIIQVQQVTAASVALNLLPLPVLTAGHLLVAAMPRAAPRLRRAQPVAAALLVVALVAGWLPDPGPALLAAVSLVR